MKFTTQQKTRIVQLFAERLTATEVVRRLQVEFPELAGETLRASQVRHYNPSDGAAHHLSAPLRAIFMAARQRHDNAAPDNSPGSQEWRVGKLIDLFHQNQANPKLCAELVVMLAKEMGGLYNRYTDPDPPDGGFDLLDIVELSPAEKAVRMRALMQADQQLNDYVVNLLRTEAPAVRADASRASHAHRIPSDGG